MPHIIFPSTATTILKYSRGFAAVHLNMRHNHLTILIIFVDYMEPHTMLFWIMFTPQQNGDIALNHEAIIVPADPSNVDDPLPEEPPSTPSDTLPVHEKHE